MKKVTKIILLILGLLPIFISALYFVSQYFVGHHLPEFMHVLSLFMFIPGITLCYYLILILIICYIKYFEQTSKFYLFLSILVILVVTYFTLIIQAPINGQVINALNNKSIEDINVLEIVSISRLVLNPAGTPGTESCRIVQTNKRGEYIFPWRVYYTFPFVNSFERLTWSVPIKWDDYGSPCFPRFINLNEEFVTKLNTLYTTGWGITSRNYLLSKKIDIYLIPKVENLVECDKAIKTELIEKCRIENARRLAVKNKDITLCKFYTDIEAQGCIYDVVYTSNNPEFCKELKNIEHWAADVDQCLRNVAYRQQNKNLCESIPQSEWVPSPRMGGWDCEIIP
jgi:hypothetical protein